MKTQPSQKPQISKAYWPVLINNSVSLLEYLSVFRTINCENKPEKECTNWDTCRDNNTVYFRQIISPTRVIRVPDVEPVCHLRRCCRSRRRKTNYLTGLQLSEHMLSLPFSECLEQDLKNYVCTYIKRYIAYKIAKVSDKLY